MDHITQLYQNRAKVLQEEVNRLEALLEAVVAAPPIDLRGQRLQAQAAAAKLEAEEQAKAKAAADAEIKKTEEAKKDIEENPISGRIAQAHDALVGGIYRGVATIKNNPYVQLGALYGLPTAAAWGIATPRWSVDPKNAGKITSIFTDQAVNQNTGEPIQGIFKKKPEAMGRGFIARAITNARNANRLENLVQQRTAAEAAEAAVESAAEIAKSQKQSETALRIAKDIKPGDMDPNLGLLRRPESEVPVGNVGSLTPAGREKIAQVLQSTGEDLTSATKELIRAKPGETHKYLKSVGAITPEDIEMGLQGAKDIAMTGKEVAGKVGRAATTPLPGSSSAVASGLAQLGAGIAGEYAGEYLVKPAAEKIGLTDLLAKGISTVVPNSVLAAGNSPAEDERADEEISNNLRRMGIRSGRLTGPMGINIGKK